MTGLGRVQPHDRFANKGAALLVRQTHNKCQRDVHAQDVLVVEMTDLLPNSLATNGDGLVGHHL